MKKNLLHRLLAFALSLAMLFCLAACGETEENTEGTGGSSSAGTESNASSETDSDANAEQPTETEEKELVVFAAASLTETLTELGAKYEETHEGVTVLFNFDSSGTLKTSIEEISKNQDETAGTDGDYAYCDLFISAGQKQMNQLDITADTEVNIDGLDCVETKTRIDLLENKVVLVVPEGNPKNITSFDDLASGLSDGSILLAMGNSDVPVGQYTQKIFAYYGLDETALNEKSCISYGSNVKEVTTQVANAAVDCGVVYCTDAYSAKLTVVDEATAEMCGQVIYPAAVMKTARYAEEAQDFLDYLTTDEAMAVFEEVGFSAVN